MRFRFSESDFEFRLLRVDGCDERGALGRAYFLPLGWA